MNYKYDLDVDCIYFKFSEAKVIDTIEVVTDVFCDYDQEQNVVGIEFFRRKCSARIRNQKYGFTSV